MIRRPPRSTRTDTLFPYTTLVRSYGEGGLRSLKFDALKQLARLYWYTVEFGLIREAGGLRIYGAGIVSSFAESVFALDSDSPNRSEERRVGKECVSTGLSR